MELHIWFEWKGGDNRGWRWQKWKQNPSGTSVPFSEDIKTGIIKSRHMIGISLVCCTKNVVTVLREQRFISRVHRWWHALPLGKKTTWWEIKKAMRRERKGKGKTLLDGQPERVFSSWGSLQCSRWQWGRWWWRLLFPFFFPQCSNLFSNLFSNLLKCPIC